MKRFFKFVTAALLVAALISQRQRVKELSRQVLSARREESASEDPGRLSPPTADVGGMDEGSTRQADQPHSKVEATPAAERRAEEVGVDLSRVEGTGSGGRITVKDVQRAAKEL
jgi:pyruvate/2-oxoglutarate dehydrogenase complex dihydrolipoamide acyltransferase (E2) component